MSETTPILSQQSGESSSQAVYFAEGQSPRQKAGLIICMLLVILSTLQCLAICIYRGVARKSSHIAFLYFMFAMTVAGIAAVHIVMVVFIKNGFITEGKLWFSYISAALVILQSIFIDILVLT